MVSCVIHLVRGFPRQHVAYDTKVRNNELSVLVSCFCTCEPVVLVPCFVYVSQLCQCIVSVSVLFLYM